MGKFGPWLKVEVRDHSPHWQAFYGKLKRNTEAEESVPETPATAIRMEIVVRNENVTRVAPIHNKKRAESSSSNEAMEGLGSTPGKKTMESR